jgi:imidazolonepropionase-like amidohydrolase
VKFALAASICVITGYAGSLAITHVTLVDTRASQARPDMTVVISGDRVVAVGPAGRIHPPRNARIVDARGKFLIPGLWDMHVHLHATLDMNPGDDSARAFFAPRLVASGVTGVRSMFDRLSAIQELRATGIAPRIVTSGLMLDGAHPFWPAAIACGAPEQGRAAVRRLKRDGVDFIKVYSLLSRETYLAIAAEAKRVGLPFAGHVPNVLSVAETSEAGQKSIEHLLGVFAACSSKQPESPDAKFGAALREAAKSYDAGKASKLFAQFVRNGVWHTPTLAVLRGAAYLGDSEFANDPRMQTLPPIIAEYWRSAAAQADAADALARKQQFERELKLVGAMHHAGVKILAGSDTPNPSVYPGDALHDELELLVRAGFSPMEALQAATIRAAEYLDRTDEFGAVAPGMFADAVLLSADPLADIANTRRIDAVVLKGKLLDRSALDALITTRR